MVRLTKKVRQQLLDQNEGFKKRTWYDSRNSSWTRDYLIKGGKLLINQSGKTSWADSWYEKSWEADEQETHSFLYKFLDELFYSKED